ncbi:DUF418 domain-containing protein [Georgenia sp. Z1344]|uniref:DUF418 domain-containing protein n=1 Tax=Georgenia sp. Z1344 TaxID=3416706 RepID=UPI003CF60784
MAQPLGPTPLAERSLAPDLARGAMLLLIALANVRAFVDVPTQGLRGYPDPDGTSALDDAVALVQLLLVDGRAYPLFGLLFGYGVWQLASRRLDRGWSADAVVSILRRRSVLLLAVGAVHGILFFPGEIIAAYGVLLLLLPGAMVRGRDQALVAWSAIGGIVILLLLAGAGTFVGQVAPMTTSWGTAVTEHLTAWPPGGVLSNALGVSVTVPLGVLAARHGLLDRPDEHRGPLARCAVVGLGAAIVLGAWYALVAAGALPAPSPAVAPVMALLHGVGGYAGGIGYAALFGLLAAGRSERARDGHARASHTRDDHTRVARARDDHTRASHARASHARHDRRRDGHASGMIRSLGRMSMSGYLLQTAVFVVVLVPWGPIALGRDISTMSAALVAVGAWVLGLVVAVALGPTGRRGPFEAVVRWWTYRGAGGRASRRRVTGEGPGGLGSSGRRSSDDGSGSQRSTDRRSG